MFLRTFFFSKGQPHLFDDVARARRIFVPPVIRAVVHADLPAAVAAAVAAAVPAFPRAAGALIPGLAAARHRGREGRCGSGRVARGRVARGRVARGRVRGLVRVHVVAGQRRRAPQHVQPAGEGGLVAVAPRALRHRVVVHDHHQGRDQQDVDERLPGLLAAALLVGVVVQVQQHGRDQGRDEQRRVEGVARDRADDGRRADPARRGVDAVADVEPAHIYGEKRPAGVLWPLSSVRVAG